MPELFARAVETVLREDWGGAKQELLHPDLICLDASNIVPIWQHKRYWDFNMDMPRPVPPWTRCLVEWEVVPPWPRMLMNQRTGEHREMQVNRCGVLCHCQDNLDLIADQVPNALWADCNWLLSLHILYYSRNDEVVSIIPANYCAALDDRARLYKGGHFGIEPWGADIPGLSTFAEMKVSTVHFQLPFVAWSLCNCKNVSLEIRSIKRSARRRLQRLGQPRDSYRILQIKPMGKLRSSGDLRSSTGKRQLPLHIVRGHFKNYDDKPLFGKHRGLYWWSMHARGDITFGTARKDYEIEPT